MKSIAELIAMIIFIPVWMAGLVIAQGFWMTAFALFPPVGWYLVTERVMQANGLV